MFHTPSIYTSILVLHSWLRWVSIITGIAATALAFTSALDTGASRRAGRWGLIFMIALDLQLLLGLLLHLVLSPNTLAMFQDFGAAMRDPTTRFWAIEHISLMLFAVVMVHVGRVLARKAATPVARRNRMFLCFALATLAMLAATPWPGLRAGRPLFRF